MLKIHTIVFFNPWIRFFELVYNLPIYVMNELIPSKSNDYFIMLLTIYSFILFNNLIGLLPYSFTLTSHLYVSFMLSFSIFFGVNIISYTKYGLKLFELFLPANTSVFLAAILVPLEFISHLIKPVSLGARLFINLMAGHTLLKVILGFAWNILSLEEFFLLFLPFVILILLFVLELGVALIQTYVFITLTCIYIQDSDPS